MGQDGEVLSCEAPTAVTTHRLVIILNKFIGDYYYYFYYYYYYYLLLKYPRKSITRGFADANRPSEMMYTDMYF